MFLLCKTAAPVERNGGEVYKKAVAASPCLPQTSVALIRRGQLRRRWLDTLLARVRRS